MVKVAQSLRSRQLVAVVLLALGVLLALQSVSVARADETLSTLLDAALSARKANRNKLTSAKMVWTRQSFQDGFVPGQNGETSGVYTMYLKDGKVATSSLGENFDKDGKVQESGERTANDGKQFRAVPNVSNPKRIGIAQQGKIKLHGDWLKIINWSDRALFERVATNAISGFRVDTWKLTPTPDGDQLTVAFVHDVERGRIEFVLNMTHGGCEEDYRAYYPSGKLQVHAHARVGDVGDGLWMPVEYSTTAYSESDGRRELAHQYALVLSDCLFNKAEAIPDETFTIPISADMLVVDHRAEKTVRYTGVEDTLSAEELSKRVVEAGKRTTDKQSTPGLEAGSAWTVYRIIFVINGVVLCLVGVWMCMRRRRRGAGVR